jgi:hypothetical protein
MQKIIENLVQTSLKGDLDEKAVDCFKELRQACVREDEAESFNRFAERIKRLFKEGSTEPFFEMLK